MVHLARAGVDLHVADQSGAVAEATVDGEHGFQPARGEDQVVVEQGHHVLGGRGDAAVVRPGVAEIALVEQHAAPTAERREPVASAVGAAVVDEDDLVIETNRERCLQAGQHRLGQR